MTSGGIKGGFQLTTKQYSLLIICISVTKGEIFNNILWSESDNYPGYRSFLI